MRLLTLLTLGLGTPLSAANTDGTSPARIGNGEGRPVTLGSPSGGVNMVGYPIPLNRPEANSKGQIPALLNTVPDRLYLHLGKD